MALHRLRTKEFAVSGVQRVPGIDSEYVYVIFLAVMNILDNLNNRIVMNTSYAYIFFHRDLRTYITHHHYVQPCTLEFVRILGVAKI